VARNATATEWAMATASALRCINKAEKKRSARAQMIIRRICVGDAGIELAGAV